MSETKNLLPDAVIDRRILWLRGQKVMLDFHLAELYDVPTRALNQAVRRNAERFPDDFMFPRRPPKIPQPWPPENPPSGRMISD